MVYRLVLRRAYLAQILYQNHFIKIVYQDYRPSKLPL